MSIDVTETVADLQATVDYIKGLAEESESVDFDAGVAIKDELLRVAAATRKAIDMIEMEMLRQLEAAPRQFGGRVFARVRKYVERHDHDRIMAVAVDQGMQSAIDPNTGEFDARKAAEAAAAAMRSFYLSASSTAKVTPLKTLGVPRKEYETKEYVGWKVSVTETDPEAAAERREA